MTTNALQAPPPSARIALRAGKVIAIIGAVVTTFSIAFGAWAYRAAFSTSTPPEDKATRLVQAITALFRVAPLAAVVMVLGVFVYGAGRIAKAAA